MAVGMVNQSISSKLYSHASELGETHPFHCLKMARNGLGWAVAVMPSSAHSLSKLMTVISRAASLDDLAGPVSAIHSLYNSVVEVPSKLLQMVQKKSADIVFDVMGAFHESSVNLASLVAAVSEAVFVTDAIGVTTFLAIAPIAGGFTLASLGAMGLLYFAINKVLAIYSSVINGKITAPYGKEGNQWIKKTVEELKIAESWSASKFTALAVIAALSLNGIGGIVMLTAEAGYLISKSLEIIHEKKAGASANQWKKSQNGYTRLMNMLT